MTSLLGIDKKQIYCFYPPRGRFEGKNIDLLELNKQSFVNKLLSEIDGSKVTEIIPLWPSKHISRFIDYSLAVHGDNSAWLQRIFWFLQESDLILLSSPPPLIFVDVVTSLLGIDKKQIYCFYPPRGRFEGKNIDLLELNKQSFVNKLLSEIDGSKVTEIIPLWPSKHISRFADLLNLGACFKGNSFFSQNGMELCNNKSSFRIFAKSISISVPVGGVCYSQYEAKNLTSDLLKQNSTLIIKKVHGGAGGGNLILTTDSSLDTSSAGAKYKTVLDGNTNFEVDAFWNKMWNWASDGNRFAVVIEEFHNNSRTAYAEYKCDDKNVALGGYGELFFEGGKLVKESVPILSISEKIITKLFEQGTLLAEFYQKIGYRGYLSCDAIVTDKEELFFTEVNARFSGSTHLYSVIAKKIASSAKKGINPIVSQYTAPPQWRLDSLSDFLNRIKENNLFFSKVTKKGVFPITPLIGSSKTLIYCICSDNISREHEMQEELAKLFNQADSG